jgi:ketosteroid isomerase-like protein
VATAFAMCVLTAAGCGDATTRSSAVATSGEEVAVIYTQRGLGADGERFEAPVIGVYEVREGKFARAQMFHYDTAAVLAFLERAAQPGPLPGAA